MANETNRYESELTRNRLGRTEHRTTGGSFKEMLWGWLNRQFRNETGAAVPREEVDRVWEAILGGKMPLPVAFSREINERIRAEGGPSWEGSVDLENQKGWAQGKYADRPSAQHSAEALSPRTSGPTVPDWLQRRVKGRSGSFPMFRHETISPNPNLQFETQINPSIMRAESGAAVSEEEARALQAQRQGNITGWGPIEQGVVDLKKKFADQIRALRDRF
jgi:hypothetical protein